MVLSNFPVSGYEKQTLGICPPEGILLVENLSVQDLDLMTSLRNYEVWQCIRGEKIGLVINGH
jgi:hypothetical protein